MFRLKKVHFRNKTFYYLNEREGKLSITVLSSTNLITDQYFAGSFSCCPVVREEVKCWSLWVKSSSSTNPTKGYEVHRCLSVTWFALCGARCFQLLSVDESLSSAFLWHSVHDALQNDSNLECKFFPVLPHDITQIDLKQVNVWCYNWYRNRKYHSNRKHFCVRKDKTIFLWSCRSNITGLLYVYNWLQRKVL